MTSGETKKTARIAVFLPLRLVFNYSYDKSDNLQPGMRVVVPFRNRDIVGVFLGFGESDVRTKKIKSILDERPIFPSKLVELAVWCADYYLSGPGEIFKIISPKDSLKKKSTYSRGKKEPGKLTGDRKTVYESLEKPVSAATASKKGSLTLKEFEKAATPLVRRGIIAREEEYYLTAPASKPLEWGEPNIKSVKLVDKNSYTKEQNAVIGKVSKEIEERTGKVTLLHGVTGSGKTEVYISLCKKALETGGAIVLVPEIALTFQLVKRFYAIFGKKVAVIHSGLTPAQRRGEWMRIQRGEASIVIGARSAIFAPLSDIRIVVVDEEHDTSYKQFESPHYNARDLAVVLGGLTGAPVLLGSATPSLESFYNAKKGKYSLARLTHRIDNRPMPRAKLVTEEDGKELPTDVIEQIMIRLGKKEQSLVFINRRGSSHYVKCSNCKAVAGCPNCSITLTYHTSRAARLVCHYCGYSVPEPTTCPECGIGKRLSYKGVGTQKVETVLKELFSKAKVERLDQDTAPTREKIFKILEKFESGETDILVGTQMTAKGHDFENLTFSVIVGADDYLSFPDFRSAERTYALITQAVGRTGRGDKGGEVVVSSSTDHYAIRCAIDHNDDTFYEEELRMREASGYPPFSRLAGIMFESNSEKELDKAMANLMFNIPKLPPEIILLGPVQALIYKVRNRYRWKLMLKGRSSKALRTAALTIEESVDKRIAVSIDIDPIGFY